MVGTTQANQLSLTHTSPTESREGTWPKIGASRNPRVARVYRRDCRQCLGEPPSLLTDADSTSIRRKNWVTVDLHVFPTGETFSPSLLIGFHCDHRLPCFPNCFWGLRGARVVRQNGALKANSCGRRSSCKIVSNPTAIPDKFAFPAPWNQHDVRIAACTFDLNFLISATVVHWLLVSCGSSDD